VLRNTKVCALAILLGSVAVHAEQFPKIEGENLLGEKITLPAAGAGQTIVVVIGFTHGSNNQTKAWAARLQHELPTYSIAVLEAAPRLVRAMAVHGIKSSVPEDQRDRFIVIYHNEKELKEAAGFNAPNDAYVLLLDKDGSIRWHTHAR
jgi:hypothetical protein